MTARTPDCADDDRDRDDGPVGGRDAPTIGGTVSPSMVDDVLLLLFQPSSGVIAGEATLFYVLGGAVLTDLALQGRVDIRRTRRFVDEVVASGEAPDDELLRRGWDVVAGSPSGAQAVIAEIGPALRSPALDRLIDRGHLRRRRTRLLGLIPSERLELASGRRDVLLRGLRATLVDRVEVDDRTAALAALVASSGALTWFDPVIPWSSAVIERAEQLQRGDLGASAAAEAVARTTLAVVAAVTSAAIAAASPR